MSNRNLIGITTLAMSNGPGLWEELQDQAIIERQYDRPFRGFFDESRWADGRWHKVPPFLRDESGATTIEFGVIAVGLSAIGYVVVQTLLKANGLG